MVIEELRFSVPCDRQSAFVSNDRLIWTKALSACAGFLGKEIWRPVETPDELRIVIRWASRNDWKAVPQDLLVSTEKRFIAAVGQAYPVLRCNDLDVIG